MGLACGEVYKGTRTSASGKSVKPMDTEYTRGTMAIDLKGSSESV